MDKLQGTFNNYRKFKFMSVFIICCMYLHRWKRNEKSQHASQHLIISLNFIFSKEPPKPSHIYSVLSLHSISLKSLKISSLKYIQVFPKFRKSNRIENLSEFQIFQKSVHMKKKLDWIISVELLQLSPELVELEMLRSRGRFT